MSIERVWGSGWEWFFVPRQDPDISGKYLFFSEDRDLLVEIAEDSLAELGFTLAKISTPDGKIGSDFVLCLYDRNDNRKQELASRYGGRENVRYRYWKSNAATRSGQYSAEFLSQKTPHVVDEGD